MTCVTLPTYTPHHNAAAVDLIAGTLPHNSRVANHLAGRIVEDLAAAGYLIVGVRSFLEPVAYNHAPYLDDDELDCTDLMPLGGFNAGEPFELNGQRITPEALYRLVDA